MGWSAMFRLAYPLLLMFAPRIIPYVIKYALLLWRLTFDKRVSIFLRALIPLALLYAIWPWDLAKDKLFIPLGFLPFPLGKFDDLIVLGLAALFLIKLSPKRIVDEHLGITPVSDRPEDKDPSNVVDGKSRIVDDEG